MKLQRNTNMLITFNGTSLIRFVVLFLVGMIMLFMLTGLLTSLDPKYRITSSSINEWTNDFTSESLIRVMGYENPYFSQNLAEDAGIQTRLSKLAFEMATSINPDDPRSLLGRELPYFSLFDGKIIVAGEGTNYTNIAYESAPPLEVLLEERQASFEKLSELDDAKPINKATNTTGNRDVVYIYQTHSRESYLPQLVNTKNPDEAFHDSVNITLVGKKLGEELEERGIGTVVDQTDLTKRLYEKGLKYWESYTLSREIVQQAMASNKDLKFLFDLHRDSQPKKELTTATINNKNYARIMFVIGGEHAAYKKNLHLATTLHEMLDKKYPGLSRGVITKQGEDTNGKFNQDLSENALLIEIGGIKNDLKEVYNTAEAIADIFSEYYWQTEKVSN